MKIKMKIDKDGMPLIEYNDSRCIEKNSEIRLDMRGTRIGYEAIFEYDYNDEEWKEDEILEN